MTGTAFADMADVDVAGHDATQVVDLEPADADRRPRDSDPPGDSPDPPPDPVIGPPDGP